MNLAEMMDRIAQGWVFSRDRYPEFPISNKSREIFALRHISYHILTAITRVFSQLEEEEHDPKRNRYDIDIMRMIVLKLFRDVLRMATLLGITAEELEESVRAKYFKK